MTMAPNFVWERPYIPEVDVSGVVVDANESQFSNGDQVVGLISTAVQRSTHQGALSQYVFLPASQLVLKPSNQSFSSAAGIPTVGQTALQALRLAGFDVLRYRRGHNEGTTRAQRRHNAENILRKRWIHFRWNIYDPDCKVNGTPGCGICFGTK